MNGRNTYSPDQVGQRLASSLPSWSYSDGAIRRVFETSGWKASLMVVNAIGHLAEVAWHHPDLSVSYARVEVALSSHDANGITDRDFALAEKIEAFISWRPDRDDGPLEGTPADERFAYLRYDD